MIRGFFNALLLEGYAALAVYVAVALLTGCGDTTPQWSRLYCGHAPSCRVITPATPTQQPRWECDCSTPEARP